MKRLIIASLGLVLVAFQPTVVADEYKDAVDRLCKRMQVCMREQVAKEEDIPPEMAAMVENMISSACDSVYEMEDITKISKEVEKSAIACFDSMSTQSCPQIEKGFETPACEKFEKFLDEY